MFAPKFNDEPKSLGIAKAGRNKRLEEKIKKNKEDREATSGITDPKGGKGGAKGAPPVKEVKKEAPVAAAGGKAVKKT